MINNNMLFFAMNYVVKDQFFRGNLLDKYSTCYYYQSLGTIVTFWSWSRININVT